MLEIREMAGEGCGTEILIVMCAEEVTTTKAGDLLLKGSRIVIPKALQDRATQLGHVGHQGIEKTKTLLREKI
jgi:hypothetical protein